MKTDREVINGIINDMLTYTETCENTCTRLEYYVQQQRQKDIKIVNVPAPPKLPEDIDSIIMKYIDKEKRQEMHTKIVDLILDRLPATCVLDSYVVNGLATGIVLDVIGK